MGMPNLEEGDSWGAPLIRAVQSPVTNPLRAIGAHGHLNHATAHVCNAVSLHLEVFDREEYAVPPPQWLDLDATFW